MIAIQRLASYALAIFVFLALTLTTTRLQAQTPEGINYQAVVRDGNGTPLGGRTGNVTFRILQGNNPGTLVYEEDHSLISTNDYGLFNLRIGLGSPVTGTFSSINWGTGDYYLNVVIDGFSSGTDDLGTTQLLSVPYALYAKSSGNQIKAGNGIQVFNNDSIVNTGDLSSTNELVTDFRLENDSLLIINEGSEADTVDVSVFKAQINNQRLGLTINNNQRVISITDGNQIQFSVADRDSVVGNEIQTLSVVNGGDSIQLSNILGVAVSKIGVDELNFSLNLSGDILRINNGSGVDLSKYDDSTQIVDSSNALRDLITTLDNGAYRDSSANNELVDSLRLNGRILTLYENNNTQSIDLSGIIGVESVVSLSDSTFEIFNADGTRDTVKILGKDGLDGSDGNSINWLGDISRPTSPDVLDAYYDASDSISYIYNGTSWDTLAQKGARGPQGIQGLQGLQGDGISWLGPLAADPASPNMLDAYFNTVIEQALIYNGTSWDTLSQRGNDGTDGIDGASINWLGHLASAPGSPNTLDAYYHTGDSVSFIYNGTTWDTLAQKGARGPQGIQGLQGLQGDGITWLGPLAADPTSPNELDAYFNTVIEQALIYNGTSWDTLSQRGNDGSDGIDGASINWLGHLASAPGSPNTLDAYYHTGDSVSFIFNGTTWDTLAQKGARGPQGMQGLQGLQGDGITWLGPLAADPTSPNELDAYFNTVIEQALIYNGTSWDTLSQRGNDGSDGSDGASINWLGTVNRPPSPNNLDAYYDATDSISYIYNGSTWDTLAQKGARGPQGIQGLQGAQGDGITWLGPLAADPTSPNNLDAYFNTVIEQALIYNGTSWDTLSQRGNDGIDGLDGSDGIDGASINWLGYLASAPGSPNTLDAYYHTGDSVSFIYNGTTWDTLAQKGARGPQGIQGLQGAQGDGITWLGPLAADPTSPNNLDAYFNTVIEQALIYNGTSWDTLSQRGNDGIDGLDGSDGIDGASINWLGHLASAPTSPNTLDAYYHTGDSVSFIYNGTTWDTLAQKGARGPQGLQGVQGDGITWLGPLAADPTSPNNLDAYFNTVIEQALIYNGTSWDTLSQRGNDGIDGLDGSDGIDGASINWLGHLASAPGSPNTLDAYYHTGDSISFIYNGTTWDTLAQKGARGPQGLQGVQGDGITWLGPLAADPTSPNNLDAYFNTVIEQALIYNGTSWDTLSQRGNDGIDGLDGSDGIDGASINWLGHLASAPGSPNTLDAYYHTGDSVSFIYNGTTWDTLAQKGARGPQGIQGLQGVQGDGITWLGPLAADPTSPNNLDAYFNTVIEQALIYNGTSWDTLSQRGNDGIDGLDGSDGIDGASINWLGHLASAPGSPNTLDAYYHTGDSISFIYNGTTWDTLAQKGARGPSGIDGFTILSGNTPPTTQGVDGDFFIDTTTYIIYAKNAGAWNGGTNLLSSDDQTLSISAGGGTISIEDGNSIVLQDSSDTNEAQSISRSGTTVTLTDVNGTGGGSFTDSTLSETDVDAMVSNNGFLTAEIDGSITNERVDSLDINGNFLRVFENGTLSDSVDVSSISSDDDDLANSGSFDIFTTRNVGVGTSITFSGFTGQNGFASGSSISNTGTNSVAFGASHTVSGDNSAAIGFRNTASGTRSYAIGAWTEATANQSFVIGSAPTTGLLRLTNNTANSIIMGTNSDTPTLTIYGGDGTSGSIGSVGIGAAPNSSSLLYAESVDDKTAYFLQNGTSSLKVSVLAEVSGVGTTAYALEGAATSTATNNFGLHAIATGAGGTNYGVYGKAIGATTNYAGYFDEGWVYIRDSLGIGTSSPASDLHIQNSSDAKSIIESTSGSFASLTLKTASREWEINNNSLAGGYLQFSDLTSGSSRLVISPDGRVGIGTTTPTQSLLQVVGGVRADSLIIDGEYALPDTAGTAGQILQADAAGNPVWSDAIANTDNQNLTLTGARDSILIDDGTGVRIQFINDSIGALRTDIGSNTGDIATNAGVISTNAGNISTNTGNISTLQSDLSTLEGNFTTDSTTTVQNRDSVNQLRTDLADTASVLRGLIPTVSDNQSLTLTGARDSILIEDGSGVRIQFINDSIGALRTDIGNNTGNIATNAGVISTNAGNISTNTGNISTLQSDLSTLEGNFTTDSTTTVQNRDSVNQLRTDLADTASVLRGLIPTVSDNQSLTLTGARDSILIEDGSGVRIQFLNDSIGALRTDIGSNAGDIATNAGMISSNAGNISTNSGNITNLQSDVSTLQSNFTVDSTLTRQNRDSIDLVQGNISDTATALRSLIASQVDTAWNQIATQNIRLGNFSLSNDGDSEGLSVNPSGEVSVSSTTGTSITFAKATESLLVEMFSAGSGTNAGPIFDLYNSRGTPSSRTTLADGDRLFTIRSKGFYAPSNFDDEDLFFLTVDGAVSTGIVPTRTDFRSIATDGSINSGITLRSSGYVGINQENPAYNLDVNGRFSADTLNINDEYTFPDTTGTAGQILVANGSGNLLWQDQNTASGGVFEKVGDTLIRDTTSDYSSDFLLGSPQLGDDGDPTHDNRLFFDKSKGAFRAGITEGTEWDDANIGIGSIALGTNNTASGNRSTIAGGENNTASGVLATISGGTNNTAAGFWSTVGGGSNNTANSSRNYTTIGGGSNNTVGGDWSFIGGGSNNNANNAYSTINGGYNNTANADSATISGGSNNSVSGIGSYIGGGNFNSATGSFSSIIGGTGNTAPSFGETVLGLFNTSYSPNSSTSFDANDRLFVIGNGSSDASRSDAFIIYKNGNTLLNGDLNLTNGSDTLNFSDFGNGASNGDVLTFQNDSAIWAAPSFDQDDSTRIAFGNSQAYISQIDSSFAIQTGGSQYIRLNQAGDLTLGDFSFLNKVTVNTNDSTGFTINSNTYSGSNDGVAFRSSNISLATGRKFAGQFVTESSPSNNPFNYGILSEAINADTNISIVAQAEGGDFALGLTSIATSAPITQGLLVLSQGSSDATGAIINATFGSDSNTGISTSASGGNRASGINASATGADTSTAAFFVASSSSPTGISTGIEILSSGLSKTYGGYFDAASGLDTTFGIYSTAVGGGINYAGYFDLGNVFIGDTLILPTNASAGRVLTALDASGKAVWSDASTGGVFEKVSGIIRDTTSDYSSDFVIGSAQLDSNDIAEYNRMIFDKSQGFFAAGFATGSQWNEANRGAASAVFGSNNTASGTNAFVAGNNNTVSLQRSSITGGQNNTISSQESFIGGGNGNTISANNSVIAGGSANSIVSGDNSFIGGGGSNIISGAAAATIAGGEFNKAGGQRSFTAGVGNITQSYNEVVLGGYNDTLTSGFDVNNYVATDRLFVIGNGTADNARTNAMVMLKDGKVGFGTEPSANYFSVSDTFQQTSGDYEAAYFYSRGTENSAATQTALYSQIEGADGTNQAIYGIANGASSSNSGSNIGVAGVADSGFFNIGVRGQAQSSSAIQANYGVYGVAGIATDSVINRGIVGVLQNSSDTIDAAIYGIALGTGDHNISVFGRATIGAADTNYSFFADARNASITNYAFYGASGNLFLRDTLILPRNAATGRVLTSLDANGKAGWTDASTLSPWTTDVDTLYNTDKFISIGTTDNQAIKVKIYNDVTDAGLEVVTARNTNDNLIGLFGGVTGSGTGMKYGGYFNSTASGGAQNIGAFANVDSASTNNIGFWGVGTTQSGTEARGLMGQATGLGQNIGIYGEASGGSANYAGYFNQGRVYIADSLGIGINAPGYPLHIASAANTTARISTASGFRSALQFAEQTGGFTSSAVGFELGYEGSDDKFRFRSASSGTIDTLLTLDRTNGRVGVQNDNPTATFDVGGAIRVDTVAATPVDGMIQFTGTDFEGYASGAWQSLTTAGATCPAGMMEVNGRMCIDSTESAASDWFDAAANCVANGKVLPSWAEWYGAMSVPAVAAALTDEDDNWEWVNDGTSNTARKVGNGNLKANANDDPDTGSEAFRCIYYK